jgi:hypothetical protein
MPPFLESVWGIVIQEMDEIVSKLTNNFYLYFAN